MDETELRTRVIRKIVAAPSVVLPTLAGATAVLGAWALGHPTSLVSFAGVAGILAGLGALASRWILRVDRTVAEVMDEAERDRARQRAAELDRLDSMLAEDDDPRSEQHLRRLRRIYDDFLAEAAQRRQSVNGAQLAEIVSRSERLFRSCVASLERSLMLFEVARRMHTEDARRRTLEARERMLEEVDASTNHLARIFDGVTTLTLPGGDDSAMASIRAELDESLHVAQRVEDRMRAIRESLEGDPAWRREGGRWTEPSVYGPEDEPHRN